MTFNQTQYMLNRYRNDEEFRKRYIGYVRSWQKRNSDKVKASNKKWYNNRSEQQIKNRKLYLEELRHYNQKNGIKGYGNPLGKTFGEIG